MPETGQATQNIDNLISRNAKYVSNFDKGDLPIPPAKKFLVSEYSLQNAIQFYFEALSC